MQRKRLVSDSTANASFAFAAVFIMLAVTGSSVVISKCEESANEFIQSSIEAESMSDIRSMVSSEMDLVIQGATSKALVHMRRNLDIAQLGEEIGRIIREHLATSYPTKLNSCSIEVELVNISATLSERCDSRKPESPVPSAVVINVELEISAKGEDSEYRSTLDLSHELESPIVFLSSKLEQLDFSAGIEGEIGDTVRSVLSQLVQLRVLQGYASPNNRSSSLNDLLSSADVEFAVNLAVILQELSDFGSLDALSWNELLKRASAAKIDLSGAWFSAAVDPFKTYILLNGQRIQTGVNLHDFALQTLYSMADQLVIRFLQSEFSGQQRCLHKYRNTNHSDLRMASSRGAIPDEQQPSWGRNRTAWQNQEPDMGLHLAVHRSASESHRCPYGFPVRALEIHQWVRRASH